MSRLRGEAGTTLVELVTALALGLIVLMAGFVLLDRSVSVSQEIADRQEAVQRGRQAMELITRQLRSQVCLGEGTEPITHGDADSVSFYADLGDGTTNVEARTLSYEDPAGDPGRIVEHVTPGVGTYPDLAFPPESGVARPLLTGVEPVSEEGAAQPIFRYFAFAPGSPTGDLQELATPLSATDAPKTVMVSIAFVALPDRVVPRELDATTLEDSVFIRIADPSRPQEGPRCL
jgi:hypothetical protein